MSPGKGQGRAPELAQRHPHPRLCCGAVWSPRGAPWSHRSFERHGGVPTAGHTILALSVTVGLVTRGIS